MSSQPELRLMYIVYKNCKWYLWCYYIKGSFSLEFDSLNSNKTCRVCIVNYLNNVVSLDSNKTRRVCIVNYLNNVASLDSNNTCRVCIVDYLSNAVTKFISAKFLFIESIGSHQKQHNAFKCFLF